MKRIPPFRLNPEPLDADAQNLRKFRWAPKDVGSRHQLGGKPLQLPEPSWPHCTKCRDKMTFYGQLDSINDDICIADCGLIYVFVCLECLETASVIHSS